MNKIEERKKEQRRALQRLKELENMTRRHQDRLKKADEASSTISEKQSSFSGNFSTANTSHLNNMQSYNKIYDPYKVTKEICGV